MAEWPHNWNELTRGVGCEMCENGRPDTSRYGVRIHAGRYTDAYLQRADVQRGYTVVIWRGRHVTEPTELDDTEAAGYWAEVLAVARALIDQYKPLKMNYETLGNSLPHLHTHLIPRFTDDPRPGQPFPLSAQQPDAEIPEEQLWSDAVALRKLLHHSPAAPNREGVKQALTEIAKRGRDNGKELHRAGQTWKIVHYTLGSFAVILATSSAITGLASATNRLTAAIIAAAAAAAAGLTTFFASEARSRTRKATAASWFELKDAAEDKLLFRLRDDDWLRNGAEADLSTLHQWQARLIAETPEEPKSNGHTQPQL